MMKRFPSLKNVIFCSVAAMLVVLSVPTNPQVRGHLRGDASDISNHRSVPAMAAVTLNNSTGVQNTTEPPSQATPPGRIGPSSWGYTKPLTAKLRIRVIDGRSKQPIEGAEVVVIESEQRVTTAKSGYTPWIDAPVLRNPKYRPFVAELHGQLGVIVYKNGYRDSIHLGIRMHEDIEQQTTVWMYKIGPGDRRIEPVLYQEPYHHIWLIELADRFRRESQMGEGPERP